MSDAIYRAPVRNYEGYALVRITDRIKDARGVEYAQVQALKGEPFVFGGGSCSHALVRADSLTPES
jgi:hypothetical protein